METDFEDGTDSDADDTCAFVDSDDGDTLAFFATGFSTGKSGTRARFLRTGDLRPLATSGTLLEGASGASPDSKPFDSAQSAQTTFSDPEDCDAASVLPDADILEWEMIFFSCS